MNAIRCNSCHRKYCKEKIELNDRANATVPPIRSSVAVASTSTTATFRSNSDMDNNVVEYRLLSSRAKVPTKATPGSVGFDLYCSEACQIKPNTCAKISTDLVLHFPPGMYGRIVDRSGLAWNLNLHILAGIIDTDYQGIVKVLIFNLGRRTVHIASGMRIAQIIFEKAATLTELRPAVVHPLPTERGSNGFGSTGDCD